jgi:hypothetical protein
MSIKTQEKQIAGRRYVVTQLPATRAIKLLRRLGHVLGPALAKAVGSSRGNLSIATLDVGSLSDAVALLFDRLSESELEYLMRELLSTAQVLTDDKWVQLSTGLAGTQPYDAIFAGDLAGLFGCMAFAIEVNYGDFFGVLRGSLQAQMGASRSAESSTSRTGGPSGDSSSNTSEVSTK